MEPTIAIKKSETIGELAAALVKFQGGMDAIAKDGTNPFFKSKYATLENIVSAIRNPLLAQGLAFSQHPSGENELTSFLIHQSGEYLASTVKMTPKDSSPQGQGSAITYMRRYALSAILGIVTDEDDDGNAASKVKAKERSGMTIELDPVDTTQEPTVAVDEDADPKKQIMSLLKELHPEKPLKTKAQVEAVIFEDTTLLLAPENYGAIIKELTGLIEAK